jgi:putative ABC transport system ATP-binding protein
VSEEALLRVVNATVRVPDGRTRRTLLQDVSFELGAGQIALVRGPSGSGKTTFLSLCALLVSPASGEVWILGEPTSRFRDSARAQARRSSIGVVFQEFELTPELSVTDNVLLPAVPLGVSALHRERASALLAQLGLTELSAQRASVLSGGERQRVALARALLLSPKVLLLDEPSSQLDAARTEEVARSLSELASQGLSLVLCTHDPRLIDALPSASQYVLTEGKLTAA